MPSVKADLLPALFIAPVMPQQTGNGLAMRAGMMLRALSLIHRVHLLVVPVAGAADASPDFARGHAADIKALDPDIVLDAHAGLIARVTDEAERARAMMAYPKVWMARLCTGAAVRTVEAWSADIPFAAVHVMRLYLATLAEPFLRQTAGRPLCVLDLDDDDAEVHDAMAERSSRSEMLRAEAEKYRALARHMLPRFDRRLVCAARDAERLARDYPRASFDIVPNGYASAERRIARTPRSGDGLRLLFVGGLGYAPNADGVVWLCGPVLAALRSLTGEKIVIDIVGAGASSALRSRASDPAVVLHGFIEDVSSFYAAADVAVAPIRMGGGTRIKILEAFSRDLPVVSTSVGAAGLEVRDGAHLLLADDPAAFAAACLRLKRDDRLASSLATNAAQLVAERYSPGAVAAALAAAYAKRLS